MLEARDGPDFTPLGTNWTHRFLERHHEELKTYWSHPLDHFRARAVNPITKEAYFDIVEKAIAGDGTPQDLIPPELMYGADETGLQQGVGMSEHVIAGSGKSVQHQQRSGNRENITVLCTICADGSSLPPAVIFKGQGYQVKWEQNNPLNASIGYSKKGYVDGEIGVSWIEIFDKATREKANQRRRLLLVDGHVSHYTGGFLCYARTHDIVVVCYPSHSTHAYQGLDVVIFAVLKQRWTEICDDYERRTGQPVRKEIFLSLYGQAHVKAFTRENITSAFRATGIVPFNRDIISSTKMAPSLEHSSANELPLTLPTPVK
ncbi:DDE-domain-containing protein, partial [Dendrothele bispora CBS 962.96]